MSDGQAQATASSDGAPVTPHVGTWCGNTRASECAVVSEQSLLPPAPPVDVHSPAELLEELASALGKTGDALVVVSRVTRRIQWCSANASAMHPYLEVGNSLMDIDGLARLFDEVQVGRRPEPFIESTVSTVHVALLHVGDTCLSLKFKSDARPDRYLQRYVADREKLFMLSRSVSVSEMATTLAHELNQPIGTIANLLQGLQMLLTREYAGELPDALERALGRASDQTRFAAGIITRVRNFTEARVPRLAPCDISMLLASTIELLDFVFDCEQVQVSVSVDESSLRVSGDEILLQQVFANLLRNAVEALRARDDERRIEVVIARDIDGVLITVSDNGSGLSDGSSDTPFEPFRSAKRDGMGIGLNICRSFIEMHRGKLWLTTRGSGGCTANVLLPESDP